MYKNILFFLIIFIDTCFSQISWIRVNQLGYLEKDIKVAVLLSKESIQPKSFEICDALTDKSLYISAEITSFSEYLNFTNTFRLKFTDFSKKGFYYLKIDDIKSPNFKIGNDVYNGTADFILKYMRQQRCGYNPFLKDSCHKYDGFIIYHPTHEGQHINVVGGWHDASDYLQYVTTSANAIYQMLFAYEQNPKVFSDEYDKDGNLKPNGIPDILDEAKWGLDWLVRMNPEKEIMFNQIADDRDHRGFRAPNEDTISYGKGLERPVYFLTGEPQGLFKYKNKATGVASTAGKFSSAFSLGAKLLKKYYPDFANLIEKKSFEAFEFGLKKPGVAQTAPCKSPYYYEEGNYVDDMELAAAQIYKETKNKNYFDYAIKFGSQEKTTPWMGADTARHYEWYPFMNLGHFLIANSKNKNNSNNFLEFFREGISKVYERGKNNPFLNGVPFIWCSNNLVSAIITQSHLYRKISKDQTYAEMETSLRDWLFGCNPWGACMIVGLPRNGKTPQDPHSAFSHVYKYPIDGGLVDGPIYASIFNKLIGIKLYKEDEFNQFQSNYVVYHDDWGDYSTNEPTMDGTASLSYYLSSMEMEGNINKFKPVFQFDNGGIIRTDQSKKQINLVFTGHEFADGSEIIIKTLKRHNIKASFFFTGDFYRNSQFKEIIIKLTKDGHYLGAHSDKHLLYAPWNKRDSLLVSEEQFLDDLKNNYKEISKLEIDPKSVKYFLPPYEWYNENISSWAGELGLALVNFSSGTYSNADYTYPEMGKQYISSDTIYKRILNFERTKPNGLNGFILLTHFGTDPRRTDKFYNKLESLIIELKKRKYTFTLLTQTIK